MTDANDDVDPHVDTVQHAAATPEKPQPWDELGLKADEYERIRDILGRRPTSSELAMFGDVERALLLQVQQGPPAPLR